MLLTQMERRCETQRGGGLGGLAASDGVGWVNVLDGQTQSCHGITSHALMNF